jgi:hypothetical protein
MTDTVGYGNAYFFTFLSGKWRIFISLLKVSMYWAQQTKAERVDEQGEESAPVVPQNEFILQSVACALYATLESECVYYSYCWLYSSIIHSSAE